MPIERVLNLPFPESLTDVSTIRDYLQRLYIALTENSYLLIEDIQREANPDASYVVVSSNDNLTNERVLTAGTGIGITDGGANSTITVNLSHLGLENLSDPNDDRLLLWDDIDGAIKWVDIGSGLNYDHATYTLSTTGLAPDTASYVTVTSEADLSNERVLTAGTGISISDGGAGGNITISTNDSQIDHDSLLNFVAEEHIRWDLTGIETIHLDRIPATLTGKDADTVDTYHLDQDVRTTASPSFAGLNLGSKFPQTTAKAGAYLSVNQSVPTNTYTTIIFDTEWYDYSGSYDTSTGEFTVPTSGTYEITARATVNMPVDTPLELQVLVNGVSKLYSIVWQPTDSKNLLVFIMGHLDLVVGDVVKIQLQQKSGTTKDIIGAENATNFNIHILSV